MDIATNHASGEEAVRAIFERDQHAAKAKCHDPDRPSSSHDDRKNKKNRWPPVAGEVAATDRQDKRPPRNDHFNQLLLEKPCTNHGYPVNHKFKDCDMMKRLLRRTAKANGDGRDRRPTPTKTKESRRRESSWTWIGVW